MSESGVTTFTSGSTNLLKYIPDSYNPEGHLAQFLSAFGEQFSQMTKILENRVLHQDDIGKAWGINLEQIGEGYANTYRFGDTDPVYRDRIKAIAKAPHGGTITTFTGVTLSQRDTGSFFERFKLRFTTSDGLRSNEFVRSYNETGECCLYEFVTASGQTIGTNTARLEQVFQRIQALGTEYSFAQPLPSNRIAYTDQTGGWVFDTGNQQLVPFGHNSGCIWYRIYSTGIHQIGYETGALWVQYPSLSYANTGNMIIHKGFNAVDLIESGNTVLHFYTHVPAGISVSFETGAGVYIFDNYTSQKIAYSIAGSTTYHGTGEAISAPLISDTGDYAIASPSYDNTGNTMATYSFEADIVNGDPAGWVIVEDTSATVNVIASLDGYSKVMDMDDPGAGYALATQTFTAGAQTNGTIEFKIRGSSNSNCVLYIKEGGTQGGILYLRWEAGQLKLQSYYGAVFHDLADIALDIWYHIRLYFDCATDTFDIWLDGVALVQSSFNAPLTSVDNIQFYWNTAAGGHCYVDSVDYSWDTDTGNYQVPYFTNRNRYFARKKYTAPGMDVFNYFYNYYGYNKRKDGRGLGSIPTGWTEWNIDLHHPAVTGDTFTICTGTHFDGTQITGISFHIAGNSGSTTNIVFDGISFEKNYTITGEFI